MLNRPVYIDLEGADLTGKSTLLKTTFKHTEYSKIICFHDRGVLTHFAYNSHYKRYPEDQLLWLEELDDFASKNGIILLVADDNDVLRNRYDKLRQDDIYGREQVVKINTYYKYLYADYLHLFSGVKQIIIDGKSSMEILEEAKELYEKILRGAQA